MIKETKSVFEVNSSILLEDIQDRTSLEIIDPEFSWTSKVFREEIKTNLRMAIPVLFTNLMQYLVNVETMSFCGSLSHTEMEGVGLAISLISAFGWYVTTGMCSSCDTMFSQSFGSNNKKRTGLFLQRSLLMMNLVPIFLWTFHFNAEPLLILLRQDPNISRVAGEFIISFAPGFVFMMNYVIFTRYMQAQGCLWPALVAGICGNVFNICSQLLLLTFLGYGFKVAATCHAFSFAVMFLIELIYILKSKFYFPTWPGFQFEAFYDWFNMFKLGIAGVCHITFTVLIWEITIFLSGLLSPLSLSAQSVLVQIASVLNMTFYGFGLPCNIRIGQCLGANKPNCAKTVYRVVFINSGVCMVILFIFLIPLRYQIPHIFTNKKDTINLIIEAYPWMIPIAFFNSFTVCCSATLRGCGRQATGGLIIFISLYLIGLPISCVTVFVIELDVIGFWIGNNTGSFIVLISLLFILECQSWEEQAIKAQQRIYESSLRNEYTETDFETQRLLPQHVLDEKTNENIQSHLGTLSHPLKYPLPKPRYDVHKLIIIQKAGIALTVISLFIFGLLIHFFLPKELYRPLNDTYMF